MRRNAGRVEFIAVREEIGNLLAQGHNRVMIYEHLAAEGKITMSYRTFCEYFRSPQKTQPLALPTLEKNQKLNPRKNESLKATSGPTGSLRPRELSFSERLHISPEEQEKLF
ncbi:MAG: TraK family protein [Desulfocapsaceae bacterium]|nr:TraK family protein [Desulfocapsaceae bacterium]